MEWFIVRHIKSKNNEEQQKIRQKIKNTAFEQDFKSQIRFNKFYKTRQIINYFIFNKDRDKKKSKIKPNFTYK